MQNGRINEMPHGTAPLLYTFHFLSLRLHRRGVGAAFVTRKSPVGRGAVGS
jgi:hypothetical protein